MTHQQLMRVYGALLWSLSKILGNPEVGEYHALFVHNGRALAPITTEKILIDCMLQVSRVYVGSFWSQPLRYVANRELFEAEQVSK